MPPSAKTKTTPRNDNLTQMTLNVPARWIGIFDKLLAYEGPGANRSDVARKAMAIGLDAMQKKPR